MYCKNCNAEIGPEFKYCMECGSPIGHADDAAIPELSPRYRARTAMCVQKQPAQKKKPLLKAIGIPVGCLILLLIAISGIGNASNEPSYNGTTVATEATKAVVSILPTDIPPTESISPETSSENTSDYIDRARAVALLEYDKYAQIEEERVFMKKAHDNSITVAMLYRQPEFYEGKEVYFGGTILQTMYDANNPSSVALRVNVIGSESSNNVVYVTYTIKDGDVRILENDYVDMYGIFDGMITYKSVLGNNVTIPSINGEYIFCHADIAEPVTTPVMKEALYRVNKNFISTTGDAFSFSNLKNAEENIFSDATNYGDCIVLYYSPYEGWDVNNHPPFYRITAFKDGTMVIFEPYADAAEGLYAIEDGTYTEYTPTSDAVTTPIATEHTTEPTAPTSAPVTTPLNKSGYVIASSGGLNIRSGPSISYEKVGRLEPLAVVNILEIQSDGTMDWGRISQGWVSMDYIVFGEPPAELANTTPRHIINQYAGKWGDIMSQRCTMNLEYFNNVFTIELSWGNGASSTAKWMFTGVYDSLSNTIQYSNGHHYTEEILSSGEQTQTTHYTNGSGYFFLADDGYVYWEDFTENVGARCIFEKY